MKVIVFVKATKESEAGQLPDPALIEQMGRFNQQLMDAGVFVAAGGLEPSVKGSRLRFQGGAVLQTDGPFAETKELVSGFWIWQVASMQEALDWARQAPFPSSMDVSVEVRGFWG